MKKPIFSPLFYFAILLIISVLLLVIIYIKTQFINHVVSTPTASITPTPTSSFCGGIANIKCPTGYQCRLDGKYPDAGGVCVR